MRTWFNKLHNKKYFYPILAFFIPFFACVGILIGNGVYPFGEYSMLHVDMYHQYCAFFSEFLQKLQNGESLFYTWNLGLGSDYVSLYVYYLASPLNWLLIFWPKTLIIEFMELTILVKIGLSSLGFFLYGREHFSLTGKDGRLHANTAMPLLLCAITYSMCGFVAAYSWDIMWMDCIALFPFIMLGLDRLVKQKKPVLYYVTLALSIWANYYISMMICMFLVIYFAYLFFSTKGGRLGAVIRFAWYSLLAGGTSCVLLLPEYYVLSYSGSQGITFPKNMEWYFGFIEELSRVNAFADVYTGRNYWPNLYSGAFTILLVGLYVLNRRISWREKAPRLLLIAFFFLSFSNNILDFIWHGFHFPDSLPGRQSFLFSFVLLCMAMEVMRKRKGNKIWHLIPVSALILAELIAGSILMDEEITSWYSFVITGLLVVCYAILFLLLFICPKKSVRLYRNVAFFLATAEVIANMAAVGFGVTNRTEYRSKYQDYTALIKRVEEKEREASQTGVAFYRMEDLERKTKNDDSFYGYPSATQFSSLMNINVSHFYQKAGMEGGKNFYCYNGATPLMTSMLSMKYLLSDDTICEGDLWKLVDMEGNAKLYEYQYPLPLGYMISDEVMHQWNASSYDDIQNINELGYLLGSTEELLEEKKISQSVVPGKTNLITMEPGYYYGVYKSCSSDTLTLTKGEQKRTYAKASHRYILDLGYCDMGEEFEVTNNKNEMMEFSIYRLNLNAFVRSYETLTRETMTLTGKTQDCIEGNIEVSTPGYLLLSVTSEPGWKLMVDGKETEYEDFQDTFIGIPLSEGYHEITLFYETPGLKAGALVSGICILLFVLTGCIPYGKLAPLIPFSRKRSEH